MNNRWYAFNETPSEALDRLRLMYDDAPSGGGSSDYYKLPEGARELQDLIEHKDMNFAVANIFKAAYRLGDKHPDNPFYDLDKIIWFAEREKARRKREMGGA